MESLDNLTILQLTYACVLFVFGLAMGSFLNVVAYRTPMGISIITPPSSCPRCAARIAAQDNLPLIGWLVLGGRCRNCKEPISVRYPLVELATGLLWAAAGWHIARFDYGYYQNVFMGLLALGFVSAMVVTFLVDMDFRIILDEISLGGLAAALAASALLPALHPPGDMELILDFRPSLWALYAAQQPWLRGLIASLFGMLLGLAVSLFIYFAGNVMFREQIEAARAEDPEVDSALGLGDVKLMAFFGAFLGWQAVLFIFITASVLGSVIGTFMKILSGDSGGARWFRGLANRWRSGDSVLPFGPFLVVGALLYFFMGKDIIQYAAQFFFPGLRLP